MRSENKRVQKHTRLREGTFLSLEIQAQLVKDIEGSSTRHLTCREICNLRPDLYGNQNSALRRAVQNKDCRLKDLKAERPGAYWTFYARAGSSVEADSVEAG